MSAEDAEELRSRTEPYISGLPNEPEARELLENYIAWMLSISNNANYTLSRRTSSSYISSYS